MDNNLNEFDVTMYGAYKMYSILVEKFGWMILANNNKNNSKTKFYIKSLNQLIKNLKKKHDSIIDHDHKLDCKIMVDNIEYLKEHAQKDFNVENLSVQNIKNNNKEGIVEYDVTMCGIHKWYGGMFEKLGWIVIAHKNNDQSRIKEYYNSLLKLYKSIELKHKSLTHEDRQKDFQIMLENLTILINHVKIDFM